MCLVSTKAPSKPHSIRIVLNSLKWDYTYAYTRKGRLAPSPSYPIVYLYYYNMCIQSGNDLTEDLSYRIIPLFHVDNTWKGFRDQVALRYTLDLTRRQFHNPFPTTSQLELKKYCIPFNTNISSTLVIETSEEKSLNGESRATHLSSFNKTTYVLSSICPITRRTLLECPCIVLPYARGLDRPFNNGL